MPEHSSGNRKRNVHRRAYLGGLAGLSVVIAGCLDPNDDDDDPEETDDTDSADDDTEPIDDADDSTGDEEDPEEIEEGENLLEYADFEIIEHELVEDDLGNARVEGVVVNHLDEERSYVAVDVRFYNEDGQLIDSAFTNETDVPADAEWVFEVMTTQDYEDVAEYDIRVSDSPF